MRLRNGLQRNRQPSSASRRGALARQRWLFHQPRLETLESRTLLNGAGQIQEAYGQIPLSFEPNRGQTDAQVRYLSRGDGYSLFLTSTKAVLSLTRPAASGAGDPTPSQEAVLRMQLVGANANPQVVGEDQLPGVSNYFIGNDPSQWRTDIPTYGKVAYHDVYPGVDLVYYGNQRQLEYDFVVAPGADPSAITLDFQGADSLTLDGQGNLIVRTAGGNVIEHAPVLYQESGGVHQRVGGEYVQEGPDRVRFAVRGYDQSRPLVIDPVLSYSTYLGGSRNDNGNGIAVDTRGDAYVVGSTSSPDFPTTAGAFQTTLHGSTDVFVSKLNEDGTQLLYSTYLGGSDRTYGNYGNAIAVDASGDAYVTGFTYSSDFPTTSGAFQPTLQGPHATFVAELNTDGSGLIYSTFLGGGDVGNGIALDGGRNAYITGIAGTIPTTPGAFQTAPPNGNFNAYVTKLNLDGSHLIYSTYLGGSHGDNFGDAIAVDGGASAWVTGDTAANNFPTTGNGYQPTAPGSRDAYVTKLNLDGSGLLYSTYLGGSGDNGNYDVGDGIAVDAQGNAYVTGGAPSFNFPTTAGAFQRSRSGTGNAFLSKLDPRQSGPASLVYSTYLGGDGRYGGDRGFGIAVDGSGNAYVTGSTASSSFPTTPTAIQTQLDDQHASNAFVAKLNPNLSGSASLVYSTYLGGNGGDSGHAIAVDTAGNAYVTGSTGSQDFPTTPGVFQPQNHGSTNAFVAKIDAITHFSVDAPGTTTAGTPFAITVKALDVASQTMTGYTGTVHFTSSDPQAMLPPDYAFTVADQGMHTFMVTLKTAGSQTITVADTNQFNGSSITGAANIVVNPAAVSQLDVFGFPSPITAGVPGVFMVVAQDAYGNQVPSYLGTVHFTSTDPQAILPPDYTFTPGDEGMHSFAAVLKTAGTQCIITTDTADSSITGQQCIIVLPAATASLVITAPLTVNRGASFTIRVTAEDPYGNQTPDYRRTVHFTSSDPQAVLPMDYTFTAADMGTHSFPGVILNTLGDQTITVQDTANASIMGSVIVTVEPILFYSAVFTPVGPNPDGVAVGDFNGDGIPDLAVANSANNTISILLGNGDGTFRAGRTLSSDGLLPDAIAVGDFTGNGQLDLVVANYDSNNLTVFLGNGDGTFREAGTYPTDLFPTAAAVGDFNDDGHLDLVAANSGAATVTVYFGVGDSTFQPGPETFVGGIPVAVAVGDFNRDGTLDVVTANADSNTVSILRGNGDGTFQPPTFKRVGMGPAAVVVADFTGNGVPDLAVADQNDNAVSVLLGNGDGAFQDAVSYAVGSGPVSLAVGDFNGDGIRDLAVADQDDNDVRVLLGQGDGTFHLVVQRFAVGTTPAALAVGDFNQDGLDDVAAADYGSNDVAVLLNAGDWPAVPAVAGRGRGRADAGVLLSWSPLALPTPSEPPALPAARLTSPEYLPPDGVQVGGGLPAAPQTLRRGGLLPSAPSLWMIDTTLPEEDPTPPELG